MPDVIHVRFSTPAERRASRLGTLLEVFAHQRRTDTDVFSLKENGELLNVLETSGTQVPARQYSSPPQFVRDALVPRSSH